MSVPVVTRDEALNGITAAQLSLHSSWPGVTGANELSGSGYVRNTVAIGLSSGGVRITTSPVTFDVPVNTVRWIGVWMGGVFKFAMPNGGATSINFMASPQLSCIVSTGHAYVAGTKVSLFNGSPPAGWNEGDVVYVRDVTADTFNVSLTPGGVALPITSGSSFGCVIAAVTEAVFPSAGTHQVSVISLAIPN